MKLARYIISGNGTDANLRSLLSQAEPDLLQLDCAPEQNQQITQDAGQAPLVTSAAKFLGHMMAVHQALYLRPELRVVTSTSGLDVVRAMQSLAEFFVERKAGDMPIAAIRGGNLLPEITEYLPANCDVDPPEIVSAQLEIGGGPLARALSEGATIVVACAYDQTAPFLAAAVSAGFCNWNDPEKLGILATASQLDNIVVEVHADGRIEFLGVTADRLASLAELGTRAHADVVCDYSGLKSRLLPAGTCTVEQVQTRPSDGWWVKLRVRSGCRAAIMLAISQSMSVKLQRYCAETFAHHRMTTKVFVPVAETVFEYDQILLLECQAGSEDECRRFLDLIKSWHRQHAAGRAAVQFTSMEDHIRAVAVPVAADSVTLAVDTRPVSEWL